MITQLPLDKEKLVAAMLYIASRVEDPTKYKIGKLIFLSDFAHVGRYGRPIIGGRYCAMPDGPVPSEALHLMNTLVTKEIEPEYWPTGVETAFVVVQVGKFPAFQPKTEPNRSTLSDSDIEVLDEVIKHFGNWTFGQLFKYTHSLPAYERAAERDPDSNNPPLSYEDFFENNEFTKPGSKEDFLENYALSRAFSELVI